MRVSKQAAISCLIAAVTGIAAAPAAVAATQLSKKQVIAEAYGKLPLTFEENRGQASAPVRYMARGAGYALFLTGNGSVLHLAKPSHGRGAERESLTLRTTLMGAAEAKVEGESPLPGTSNYITGNDPSAWLSGVRQYGRVAYSGVYPGIDLVYYGNQRQLEYDFVVAPGADPKQIRMQIEGARELRIDRNGDLVIVTEGGELRHKRPVVYQTANGRRRMVDGRYAIENGAIEFRLARYDRRKPLVIDPILAYATYLGGTNQDEGTAIAVDSAGQAYVTGYTVSGNFPVSFAGPGYRGGAYDAFVSKLSAAGNRLLFSSYIGGNGSDQAWDIAADDSGNVYLTGSTSSTNFPMRDAVQDVPGGLFDAFVLKLSTATGVLAWSTYLGGFENDGGLGIAIDATRAVYVVGTTSSTNFYAGAPYPFFRGGSSDGFIFKFNPAGTRAWSSYLGGQATDYANAVAVDANGSAVVTGFTNSLNFPVVAAVQPSRADPIAGDAFVTKFLADGSFYVYSTYHGGGAYDEGWGVAVDAAGSAYVVGDTASPAFPVVNAQQPVFGGTRDAFVTRFSDTGARLYSTFLGGTALDQARDVALDAGGLLHVVGSTVSSDFPILNPMQSTGGGSTDTFIVRLNAAAGTRLSSTYYGGAGEDVGYSVAVDSAGTTYLTGTTSSTNLAVLSAVQGSFVGMQDAFVLRVLNCEVTVSPATATFNYQSNVGTVSITGASSCPWTAVSLSPWLTVIGNASGSGNGTITYAVSANAGGQRTGTISISGVPVTITQGPAPVTGCIYPFATNSVVVPASGSTGQIPLQTTGCAWTAASGATWAQIFPLSGTGDTTLNYTIYPNFSLNARSTTFTVIGAGVPQSFTVIQAGNVGTSDQRFVALLYFNFFGRYPTQAEIDYQVLFGLGTMTRAQLTLNFFNSPEFNAGGRFVAGLYRGLLGRDPEFGGWLFQRNALATGQATQDQLIANFLGSAEFQARWGTLTNEQFVNLLYTTVLNRTPTLSEIQFHSTGLNAGTTTRVQVAKNFLLSAEFQTNSGARLNAFLLYATLLQRDPSVAELNFRATQLSSGVTLLTLIQEILSSPEFLAQL